MAHFYDSNGILHAQVPYRDGRPGLRDATLADARKELWYPSVTTYTSVLAKPPLVIWQVNKGIETALAMPGAEIKEIKERANDIPRLAAEFGTAVHDGLRAGFHHETHWTMDVRVKMVTNAFWPWYNEMGFDVHSSECAFADKRWGVGGTADWIGLYNHRPAIVDWKTQEFTTLKENTPDGPNFYDPEHPLQICGYDCGLNLPEETQWISVLISRNMPGLIAMKIWDKTPEEKARRRAQWHSLVWFWQLTKNYYPGDGTLTVPWEGLYLPSEEERLLDLEDKESNIIQFPEGGRR